MLEGLDTSGRHVLPVFITIDPARDTPARLKSYFETADFHKRSVTRAAPAPHPRRITRRRSCRHAVLTYAGGGYCQGPAAT